MADIRKHVKVGWAGGEPVDIVTNARDIADASEIGGNNAALAGFALAYCALRRYGVNVPAWEQFLDELDSLSMGSNGQTQVVPTQPLASTAGPSL